MGGAGPPSRSKCPTGRHLVVLGLTALGIFVAPCAVTRGNFRRDSAPDVVSSPVFRMTFDFDTAIPRQDTDSQKWQKYAGRDILPMWVADMDFKCAPAILAALHERVDHGVFGYSRPVKSTVESVVAAMERNYGWKIDAGWIVWLPGLVVGLNVTAQAFAEPGDEVLTLSPVYPPFMSAPKNSARASVQVPFELRKSAWTINWDALERAVTPRTRLFYLCNPPQPHRPCLAPRGTRAPRRVLHPPQSRALLRRDPLRSHSGSDAEARSHRGPLARDCRPHDHAHGTK